MVDYMNLAPGEEQVRQDGFSRERELADVVQTMENELVETLEELAEYRLASDTPSLSTCKRAMAIGLALTTIGSLDFGFTTLSVSSCVLMAFGIGLSSWAAVLVGRAERQSDGRP